MVLQIHKHRSSILSPVLFELYKILQAEPSSGHRQIYNITRPKEIARDIKPTSLKESLGTNDEPFINIKNWRSFFQTDSIIVLSKHGFGLFFIISFVQEILLLRCSFIDSVFHQGVSTGKTHKWRKGNVRNTDFCSKKGKDSGYAHKRPLLRTYDRRQIGK